MPNPSTRSKTTQAIKQAFPLFLVGLTLRPLTTVVGPVLPEMRAEFGMSATSAALLTTIPIVVFGLGAFFVPRLLHRVPPNTALSLGLVIILLGAHLRIVPNLQALFFGTVVIGIGVAIGNVVPTIIARRDFPANIGLVIGLVAGAISLSAAIGALVTYPLTEYLKSWRLAMEIWALLPLLVLFFWHRYSRQHTSDVALTDPRNLRALARNPLAWALVVYFGFQSTNYYSLGSWLPTILRDSGIDPTTAGYQLAVLVLLGFPTGLLVPPLATHFKSQVSLCVSFVVFFGVGLIGIYLFSTTGWWPAGTWLWVTLLGIGLGASFPLGLTLALLRTENPESARDLTAFMQGFGYFLSALGPLVLGAIRDSTNSWSAGFLALGVALIIQLITGVLVSRPIIIRA